MKNAKYDNANIRNSSGERVNRLQPQHYLDYYRTRVIDGDIHPLGLLVKLSYFNFGQRLDEIVLPSLKMFCDEKCKENNNVPRDRWISGRIDGWFH